MDNCLFETLLDSKEKNDYVDPARRSAARHLSLFDEVENDLAEENQDGTSPRPISEYVGKYWNLAGNWFIKILTLPASAGECDGEKKLLFMAFQGLLDDLYELKHYHNDVFTWRPTRDDAFRRGRFTFDSADYQRLRFGHDESNKIDRLSWSHEPHIPESEIFRKASEDDSSGAFRQQKILANLS